MSTVRISKTTADAKSLCKSVERGDVETVVIRSTQVPISNHIRAALCSPKSKVRNLFVHVDSSNVEFVLTLLSGIAYGRFVFFHLGLSSDATELGDFKKAFDRGIKNVVSTACRLKSIDVSLLHLDSCPSSNFNIFNCSKGMAMHGFVDVFTSRQTRERAKMVRLMTTLLSSKSNPLCHAGSLPVEIWKVVFKSLNIV